MRPGGHETDPKDLRRHKLADVAGRGWPPDQGGDLALGRILFPDQRGKALDFVYQFVVLLVRLPADK